MELKTASLVLLGAETVVLMAFVLSEVGGLVFLASENKLLPLNAVNRTQRVIRRCDCRVECGVDPLCNAYTSVLEPEAELVLCMYSYAYVFVSDLEAEKEGEEAWTFLKTRKCPASYEYVAGTGCVSVLGAANFTVAETTCPSGSRLASPPSDAAYYHLARYVNRTVYPASGEQKFYIYLGIKRINGVWTWLDGHVIPSTRGTSLWLAGDPNEDVDCAIMLFNSVAGYYGKLADSVCSGVARVMCALR